MRDGDAAADAGRSQRFALDETVEQAALLEAKDIGGAAGQLGQQGLLAGRLHAGQNGLWAGQQISDFHNYTNGLASENNLRPARGAPL